MDSFAERLGQIVAEYGSRYRLAKASGLPLSTLQSYSLGSKPGLDAVATLARVANVDLNWLVTGAGQMRSRGQSPGAVFADLVGVDQYDPDSSIQIPTVVNIIPFARSYLENELKLKDPSHKTLLVIASRWEIGGISHGDLLLVDRHQAELVHDGIYLFNLPGFTLRAVYTRPGGKVRLAEPPRFTRGRDSSSDTGLDNYEVHRRELVGSRGSASRVVGKAVWFGRPL